MTITLLLNKKQRTITHTEYANENRKKSDFVSKSIKYSSEFESLIAFLKMANEEIQSIQNNVINPQMDLHLIIK